MPAPKATGGIYRKPDRMRRAVWNAVTGKNETQGRYTS